MVTGNIISDHSKAIYKTNETVLYFLHKMTYNDQKVNSNTLKLCDYFEVIKNYAINKFHY